MKQPHRRRSLFTLIIFLFLSFPGAFSQAQGPPSKPKETILWMDSEGTEAMFVPELLLQVLVLGSLPLAAADLQILEEEVARAEQLPLSKRRQLAYRSDIEHRDAAPDFLGLAQTAELCFVGRVVERVAGWDTWRMGVSQMVWVAVEEIIRDPGQRLRVGGLLAYAEYGGEVSVQNLRLWSPPNKGQTFARPGRTLLIMGAADEGDPRVVETDGVFPLSAGRAYAYSRSTLSETSSVALTDVRQAIRQKEGR